MRNIFHLFTIPILVLAPNFTEPLPVIYGPGKAGPDRTAISCGPSYSLDDVQPMEDGKFIIPLPGWGGYAYPISTVVDSAQFYFNQGLNMYYSYHMKESLASFREAARFDPACPMTYWGQALCMGPYYNNAHRYAKPKSVTQSLQLMNLHSDRGTAKEKKLLEVMNLRYSDDDKDGQREALNQSYALGMKELCALYDQDPDIQVLYVDAMMLIHAWDFWYPDGSPRPWTPELVSICERILKQNPKHPAALHYHIHLTEASFHPEVALADAEILKKQLPGVAHMVHMASHEYERNGVYTEGVRVNFQADQNLILYDSLAKNISLNNHSAHYFAVQAYCAMSAGMYRVGMEAALNCRKNISPDRMSSNSQFLYMMPVMVQVRLGKWQEILKDTAKVDQQWPYASVLSHFARGLAQVYTGHPDLGSRDLEALRQFSSDKLMSVPDIPFNRPSMESGIAENILAAAISFANQKPDEGTHDLKRAIQIEDQLIYSEPKSWLIPSRQFLGAYLLELGKPEQAEKIYREDLYRNPNNGWSLLGLFQSLNQQGKAKDPGLDQSKYLHSFSESEELPAHSVYFVRAKS
jgi:tetratricopeptide (TPR) repeat protein